MIYSVDRLEGGYAVLIGDGGERKDLPLEALGGEAVKEGDILERAEDGWHIRRDLTEKRKERLKKRSAEMFE